MKYLPIITVLYVRSAYVFFWPLLELVTFMLFILELFRSLFSNEANILVSGNSKSFRKSSLGKKLFSRLLFDSALSTAGL